MSDRDEIVEAARELDARTLTCAGKSVRYERADDRELAAAIDIISAHGCPDELTGDREHGRHGARIGRYVLWSDPQRVVESGAMDGYDVAVRIFEGERATERRVERLDDDLHAVGRELVVERLRIVGV